MVAQARTKQRQTSSEAGQSCTTEMIQEYPLTSLLVVFGVGMGIGVVIGQAVGGSVKGLMREETTAEKLSGQIRDALKKALPESVMRHMSF